VLWARAGASSPAVSSAPAASRSVANGTPDFLAPEQAWNSQTVDIRADLYSLG